jgi:hypothetical protein
MMQHDVIITQGDSIPAPPNPKSDAMPVTVQLDDDVVAYFHEHGRFSESYSDALRRWLPGFDSTITPPTAGGTSRPVPAAERAVTTAPASDGRNHYPDVFGYSLTSVVRALGALGWKEEEATGAMSRRGISTNPAMVRTQIGWGRQWGKNNPLCRDGRGRYGGEPPVLTDEQLRVLRGEQGD